MLGNDEGTKRLLVLFLYQTYRSSCRVPSSGLGKMIRQRQDCLFYFFTKRIDRLEQCIPPDWGTGYENVLIGCTVENQDRADYRMPLFMKLPIRHKSVIVAPIKHRSIIAAPLLERIDILPYLNEGIEEVSAGGESGVDVRPCDFDWILDLRRQCVEKNIPFHFHQTGAYFIKDGRQYRVHRKYQHSQARKAGIDFRLKDASRKRHVFYRKRRIRSK